MRIHYMVRVLVHVESESKTNTHTHAHTRAHTHTHMSLNREYIYTHTIYLQIPAIRRLYFFTYIYTSERRRLLNSCMCARRMHSGELCY